MEGKTMSLFTKIQKETYTLKTIFWLLVVIFILIVSYFIIPSSESIKRAMFPITAVLGFVFLLLGIALIFLTIKQKIKGKSKLFLILTLFLQNAIKCSKGCHDISKLMKPSHENQIWEIFQFIDFRNREISSNVSCENYICNEERTN